METGGNENMLILAALTVLTCVLINCLYKRIFRGNKKEAELPEADIDADALNDEGTSEAAVSENRPSNKNKKRALWKNKTEFTHPWLLKNLKGHPGTVLHVDFSANGKYLAATCEEVIPAPEAVTATPRRKPRERRRPPSPMAAPKPPPRICNAELMKELDRHILDSQSMWTLGYPMELEPNSTKAILYVNPPVKIRVFKKLDVNATEFIPGGSQNDSGCGSWESSPRSDSDEEMDSEEHICVRCDASFRVGRDGEYITRESCRYHWGRLSSDRRQYQCCEGLLGSNGCTMARLHVWNGTRPGMNGPLDGFVRARSPRGGVYGLDTEMCYTTCGLELASIAVVGTDGRTVYKSMVKPSGTVIDLNTRFSGIRSRDLVRATKTLKDVQNDILGFIGTDTILIGHALENDLRALKLLHSAVVDTCVLYPHARGFPLRRSLRTLAAEVLERDVQRSSHSPLEDARTAIDLVLVKVHEERLTLRRQVSPIIPNLQPYDPLIGTCQ